MHTMLLRIATILATAVLVAVPTIFGTGAASATSRPSDATWERLAGCESGHRWHISTGNGYYGGLQISRSTWRGYGGKQFAVLPHYANRSQQIVVAERILAGQGWKAWPACSRRIGVR